MKMKRLTAVILALACLALALGAWAVVGTVRISKLNGRIAELEAALNAASQPAAAVADPDAVAAEFNGGVVTAAEAAEEYAVISSYYQLLGMTEEEYAEDAKYTVLDGLVEGKILEAKAREAGVYELTDERRAEIEERVTLEYEDNIRYYMDFRFDAEKSEEEVRQDTIAYLEENGYSYEDMLENALNDAWRNALYEHVTSDMTVSEDQLRQFYDSQVESAELTYSANFAEYEMDCGGGHTIVWNPEGVRRVQSIMLTFNELQSIEYLTLQGEGAVDTQAIDTLYSELETDAQVVLDRLNAGESFDTLMSEYGADASGTCVSERSTLCGDAFRDAAMALSAVGDVSGLVRVDGGVCIIRYAEDVPAGQVAYELVRDDLLVNYEAELKSSQYNATVMQWIQEADIKYYTDRF